MGVGELKQSKSGKEEAGWVGGGGGGGEEEDESNTPLPS